MSKIFQLITAATFLMLPLLMPQFAQAADAPNIILFLVDDMGWTSTSVQFLEEPAPGNHLYDTPNMERLAARGMRFSSAYAASPVCSPTRVSLMTGRNPARSHVTSWVGHSSPSQDNSYLLAPTWSNTGVQPGDSNIMLPTLLAEAGYRTIHVGKAHFGGARTEGGDPTNLGFEINIGGSHKGGPGTYFSPWLAHPDRYPYLDEYPRGTYITTALTTEANKVIDDAVEEDVPFFMNMALYAVHTPIKGQGDPEILPRYADRPNPEDDFASMIVSMDNCLGAILDNLEEEGIAENTLILFMSDNGGLSNHTRNMEAEYTLPNGVQITYARDAHNAPLKSGKGASYEGGIRVPMIVAWAGQGEEAPAVQPSLAITPGSLTDVPVISDDFFPTILQTAGVAIPEGYELDGKDFTPLLTDTDTFDKERPIYFHFPHQWYRNVGCGFGIEPFSAIRQGDWKLLYFYGDGRLDGERYDPRWELYNLANDIGEDEDLSEAEPAKVAELATALQEYLVEVGAPIPISRSSREPAQLPAAALPSNE